MVQYRLNIETESRIRWKVYVRFGGEHLEIAHVHMIRRRVLSLHFKFSDLSTIAYNHMMNHQNGYKVKPQFYVINFDDPRRSHRCNPIHPDFMSDISDAYESAYTIMLNLNKTWVQKQGDFFVESPIILFAAIIWYLRIYKNGKYCTFPHAIELLNRRYEDVFPILTSYPELENYLSPFMDAWQGGAMEQLAGQIASAKIPLSRMISPQLYWVMSASEFTLDINNPEEPKILCVGNNPDRQNIYGAALGLYNSRIVKLINKKGLVDELNKSLKTKFNTNKDLIKTIMNYQVFFNTDIIEELGLDYAAIKQAVVDRLKKDKDVHYAFDMEKTSIESIPEELKFRAINGYNRERSGGVQIVLKPGHYDYYSSKGTTHDQVFACG